MRKLFLAATTGLALLAASPALSQSFLSMRGNAETQALTIDSRGVLTMAPLLEKVTPAVVSIETSSTGRSSSKTQSNKSRNPQEEFFERFFGQNPGSSRPQSSRPRSSIGSGVIVDARKGYIITNHHVIDKADEIYVKLEDRRELEAELVGSDPKTDIAILKVKASGLTDVKFADSSTVKVGDYTIAIGNPFGLGHTVTQGIVSAKGREFQRRGNYEDFIQTDASINPGNSGGALVNSKGELIGINTAIVSRSGGNNGIGFAVPARMAKSVMKQLVETGEVKRGRIGVTIQDITPDLKDALDLSTSTGALVNDVLKDSPADNAGLKKGDIIISFNGEDILDGSDIRNAVGYVQPGESAKITYMRDKKRRSSRIEVEEIKEEREVLDEDIVETIPEMESFSGASLTNIPEGLELRGGDEGVFVKSVERGSKAARAGLRKGDVIRAVNRMDITSLSDFEDAIKGKKSPMALTVERNGQTTFMAVR
ncbi:MAG: DegQ family serine endoprotease [Maricaulaceae bacterium]